MKKNIITLLSSLTLLLASQYTLASNADRRDPPSEAFTACEGMSTGDSSTFSGRNGESITGTCEESRDGSLVLRPDNAPDRRGPPPEAFTACEDMSTGDSSAFSGRNGESITGTCEEGRDGSLVLRPDNAPDRRGPPSEAFTACEGMSTGDSSAFSGRNGESITGTCEEGRDGSLVLRPDNAPDRRGPPSEAFTACEGMSTGDSSAFSGRNGELITGTCEESNNGSLVLHPDNAPSHGVQKS